MIPWWELMRCKIFFHLLPKDSHLGTFQQTRDVYLIFDQCWSTLAQHWSNIGWMSRVRSNRGETNTTFLLPDTREQWPLPDNDGIFNRHRTLAKRRLNAWPPAQPGKPEPSTQCWSNIGPASKTLGQHWTSTDEQNLDQILPPELHPAGCSGSNQHPYLHRNVPCNRLMVSPWTLSAQWSPPPLPAVDTFSLDLISRRNIKMYNLECLL